VVRPDITFGAYCWRQGIGYGTWVRPCPRYAGPGLLIDRSRY
jgi:hypothetical protein